MTAAHTLASPVTNQEAYTLFSHTNQNETRTIKWPNREGMPLEKRKLKAKKKTTNPRILNSIKLQVTIFQNYYLAVFIILVINNIIVIVS